MSRKFTLNAIATNDAIVSFHPVSAESLGISAQQMVKVRFGLLDCSAQLRISRQEDPKRITISRVITEKLMIPLFCHYEIVMDQDILMIGPYMAIVPEDMESNLARRIRADKINTASLFHFTRRYDEIGGAILAFSEEGILQTDRGIKGYMFNPQKKEWVKGVYPYPAALFKKLRLRSDIDKHLEHVVGKSRIFNNPLYDKWQVNYLLGSVPELQPLLPDTILYQEPKDIRTMLKRHRKVYVKPITGVNATGIWKIRLKRDGRILVQTYRHGRDIEYLFSTDDEVNRLFKRYFHSCRMIVQQGLNLLDDQRRMVDFRLILVRDQFGEWRDRGIYARHGQPDRVVSNRNSGAEAKSGKDVLVKTLGFGDKEARLMRERMSSTAFAIGKRLNECGAIHGNLGLDLAIDRKRRLWIIEVNQVDPGHSIVYKVGNKALYYQIRLDNMLYAKRLAGFVSPECGIGGAEDG